MRITKYFFVLLSLSLFLNACKKDSPDDTSGNVSIYPPQKPDFPVIGYFPSYRIVKDCPDRMFRMCKVVNYAFANLDGTNKVTIANPLRFDSLYKKAKSNGAMVFLSVSGSTDAFASMSGSSSGREIFVKDIMTKVRQYRLDGIDVDWEYPKSSDGTGSTFSVLMKLLSDSLHVNGKYFLTAAISPGLYSGSIRDGIRNEVFQYIDWFNVMIYDDFSTDPSNPYRQHSPFSIVQASLNYWVNNRGMPKNKCIVGIPVYGRPSGMTQTGTTLTYNGILQQGGSALSDSAKVSAAGFMNYTIYYNGQPTVKRKAAYARNNGGGIMFWEMGQDATDDRSLIKAACDTLGIKYN